MGEERYVTLATHEEFAKRQDEENRRQNERLRILEGTVIEVRDLTISVKGLAENMKSMLQEQEKQNNRLLKLENKDVEKLKKIGSTVIKTALTALVSGVVGFLLCKFGIS